MNVEVAPELMSADERAQAAAALRKIADHVAQAPADAFNHTASSSGELLARADEVTKRQREVIAGLGAAFGAAVWPLRVVARAERTRRIGVLTAGQRGI